MKNTAILLISLLLINFSNITAQVFTLQSDTILTDVYDGSIDWGDFDNDGDLDVLLTGMYYSGGSNYIAEVHRNDGNNIYTKMDTIVLSGTYRSDVLWGDYNNDGDLDIIITGRDESTYTQFTKLYKNNGNSTFSEQASASLPDLISGALDWGDYDNDGDLDIIMSGSSYQGGYITKIFQNDGDSLFTELAGTNFQGLVYGSVQWGDYDSDGDLDILLTGHYQLGTSTKYPRSKIYRNEGNDIFAEQTSIQLTGVTYSDASWGDIDNDGDLDILLSGDALGSIGATTKIYRNNGNNTFSQINNTGLFNAKNSSCDWGDYDNDGDLDIILSGRTSSNTPFTKVYTNNGNFSFSELISDTLIGIYDGYTKWGDYDNDGDLDILMTGRKSFGKITTIYRNDSSIVNIRPSLPTNLTMSSHIDDVILKWSPSIDNSTPVQALTYNVCIGDSVNSINIKAPQSLLNSGFHQVARFGEIRDTAYLFGCLSNFVLGDTIFWKVQAIDNGKLASYFSSQDTVTIPLLVRAIGDSVKKINDTVPISVIHNSNQTVSYSWSPTNTLNNPNIASPIAFPVTNTTYYVTVTSGTSASVDSVCVNITPLEDAYATGIAEVLDARVAIGDFDNDNDLDILISGIVYHMPSVGSYETSLFKNNGNNSFTQITQLNMISTKYDHIEWVDFNNDGYLDIMVIGDIGWGNSTCKIYKNNGNSTFTEMTNHGLPASYSGSFDAGDYDNDGDLDIVIAAKSVSGNAFTIIYKNNGNFTFTMQNIPLAAISAKQIRWGDYDNNGTLDLIYGGNSDIRLYRNNGDNTFTNQNTTSFPHLATTEVSWGDYNNDGFLDIFIMGENPGYVATIFKNNGNSTFTEQNNIELFWGRNGEWGDYNNDGLLDIIITSSINGTNAVYKNMGNGILKLDECDFPTASSYNGDTWGDFDNDSKLDFFIVGTRTGSRFHMESTVYKNNSPDTNVAPNTPTGLVSYSVGDNLYLAWNKPIDSLTPSSSLSYYVNIGYTPNGREIKRGPSDPITGYIRQPRIASIQDTSYYYKVPFSLQNTTLYWSVQAVDNAFRGSAFSQIDTMQFQAISANLEFVKQPKSCEGGKVFSVKLFNHGLYVIDSITIGWKSNGTLFPNVKWTGSLFPNDSIIIKLDTSFNVNAATVYNFDAFIMEINGTNNFSVLNDTVSLNNQSFYSKPFVNLGNDTIYCFNHQVILNAGAGLSEYNWSTGDTTQILNLDSNTFILGSNQYSVLVTDSMQCFNSDTINLLIDPCAGIQSLLLSFESINIVPNPNSGRFSIVLNKLENRNYTLEIFNVLGEKIYTNNIHPNNAPFLSFDINISSYAKGYYMVKLVYDGRVKVRNLIIK